MRKISEWMTLDGNGVGRVFVGTNPDILENRVAFIEKTPRVRIRESRSDYDDGRDHLNWAARPWKGDGPDDAESREWCDKMLVLLGYELP